MLKPQIVILATLLTLAAAPVSALYKCKDAKGKTYYTDRPPAECLGKEVDELSTQGRVVRKREAALTPEQRAAREAEEKRNREKVQAANEERRKNKALLSTYASEKDIEDSRRQALKQAEQATKEIEKRIMAAKKRTRALAREKEFYVNKPMPKKLNDDMRDNEMEIQVQQKALVARKKEADEINAKYDEDKRRYQELTGAKPKAAARNK